MFSKIKDSLGASLQHLAKNQPFVSVDRLRTPRQNDQVSWESGDFLISKRKIVIAILLYVFTLGIYGAYWKYRLVKNIRSLKKDDSDCTGEMLCLLLVPFYAYYWWYSRGKTIRNAFAENGVSARGNPVVYLLFSILGLDFVSLAIMQSDFNSLPSETVELPSELVTLFSVT